MTHERTFAMEDLFFSTTDLNGKIIFGNKVFTEISGYTFEEMVGRPHSMIRHPDMPRAVFRLLWTSIQQGRSIGAFVKNKAKDGGYYWVFAYVVTIGEVYLSVRFKPTAIFLEKIKTIYSELRDLELSVEREAGKTKDDAIQASLKRMGEILQSLGFSDYFQFIESAMVEEYCARDIALRASQTPSVFSKENRNLNEISAYFKTILDDRKEYQELSQKIKTCTDGVASLTEKIQLAALNLIVKSKREQKRGEPLAVVSSWLQSGSFSLQQQLNNVVEPIRRDLSQLQRTLFNVTAALLQVEMMQFFLFELANTRDEEQRKDQSRINHALALLAQNCISTFHSSINEFELLTIGIGRIHETFAELQRSVVSLSLAQVNGLTECCRLSDAESFGVILHAVMGEISSSRRVLDELEMALDGVNSSLHHHLRHRAEVTKRYEDFCSSFRGTTKFTENNLQPIPELQLLQS